MTEEIICMICGHSDYERKTKSTYYCKMCNTTFSTYDLRYTRSYLKRGRPVVARRKEKSWNNDLWKRANKFKPINLNNDECGIG